MAGADEDGEGLCQPRPAEGGNALVRDQLAPCFRAAGQSVQKRAIDLRLKISLAQNALDGERHVLAPSGEGKALLGPGALGGAG